MIDKAGLEASFVLGEAVAAAGLYKAVNIDSAGTSDTNIQVELADAAEVVVGILQGYGALDEPVRLVVAGVSKALAGAAVTVNAALTTDSAGRLIVTTTDTDPVCGYALTAASAANEVFLMVVDRGYHAG